MAKVCELNRLTHLLLVVLVKDFEHFVSVSSHLYSTEVDTLFSELFYLLLHKSTLRISLGIVISIGLLSLILCSMAGRITKEDRIFAPRLPALLESVFEPSSDILWSISTSKSIKLAYEFLTVFYVRAKWKDLRNLISIAVIPIGNNGDSDLDVKVLVSNTVDNRLDLLLTSVDPAAHGASAINDEHHIKGLV